MNINALKILKYLLDLIYICLLLAVCYMIFAIIKTVFITGNFQDLGISSESRLIFITDIPSGIVFILGTLGILMIFGVSHYCRKTINIWYKKDFFNSNISKYLHLAGILTLSSIALKKIPVLIYDFFYPEVFDGVYTQINTVDLSFGSESIILSTVFGLFLLILSKVIAQGRTIQQENDLTI